MHTPTTFIHLLRACDIHYTGHKDIVPVNPPEDRQWNTWCWATKHRNPFMVFKCGTQVFSVSRRRKENNHWGYLVRWPFRSLDQAQVSCDSAPEVAALIRKNRGDLDKNRI